jgi:hypothetical protein
VSGNFIQNSKKMDFSISEIFNQPYIRFQLNMNRKLINIDRVVGKLDNILSYVGGLIEIIISFFAFFMMSYSQYKY